MIPDTVYHTDVILVFRTFLDTEQKILFLDMSETKNTFSHPSQYHGYVLLSHLCDSLDCREIFRENKQAFERSK